MSLKDFHLVFISAAIILAFVFTYWAYNQYAIVNNAGYLLTAIVSAIVAIGLIAYELLFIKKAKKLQ